MRASGRGHFSVKDARLRPGSLYSFSVDGGPPLPDPRSAHQPQGVHGPSAIVEHAAFAWHDAGWDAGPLADAVICELHIGTFSAEGTFDGAIAHLDHLAALGVTAVELLPVVEFPGARGWGYDGVDLFAPHHAYGGPDGLKRLIDACHARGLAVIIDCVYNHLGPDGNHLGSFGPYFTDAYHTPWGAAVNFDDRGSDEVRAFVVDNVRMWLRDYHADGIRLDAIHAIFDRSAVHILEELSTAVDALESEQGRTLWLIAESSLNDPSVVTPRQRGGLGVDAQWSDDFHHALHSVLTGETSGYYSDFGSIDHLCRTLGQVFAAPGEYSSHRDRRHGRPITGLDGTRFLGFLQNHDQVGNRATGERISQLVSTGLAQVGAALTLLSPFVPMLFAGEEWGASTPFLYFTDHESAELGAAVSRGRREEFRAFGWKPDDIPDPQDVQTFERSRLRWDELHHEPHAALLRWHRDLIALRRRIPSLRRGDLQAVSTRHREAKRWLIVEREEIAIAANLAAQEQRVETGKGDLLLASAPARRDGDAWVLAPESVLILSR